jgi:hypothetical protein
MARNDPEEDMEQTQLCYNYYVKKLVISKLFLYRHRFLIGYILLGLAFATLLVFLPTISPDGLSRDEMTSAVASNRLTLENLLTGDLVNLPYRFLQQISFSAFGLSVIAIKLPSILLGLAAGLLLVLLLNRWFKNNVALLAAILTTLTTSFLFAAGSGTPLIMYIFWPLLLLWLGSKIFGNKHPNPIIVLLLGLCFALATYTPYFIYLLIVLALLCFLHPHLRFTLKTLPRAPLIVSAVLTLLALAPLAVDAVLHTTTLSTLFFTSETDNFNFFSNLGQAFAPFFSFTGFASHVYLAPLFGFALTAIILTGIIALTKNLYTSRGVITTALTIFSIIIAGLTPAAALLIFTPIAILVASGIELVLGKWYSLFPENPYARIFALIPISIVIGLIILPDLFHYIYGYQYDPAVANEFNVDLSLINDNSISGATLLVPEKTLEYDFYKILERRALITVADTLPDRLDTPLISLGRPLDNSPLPLHRIITSPKSNNSDRLYVYISE